MTRELFFDTNILIGYILSHDRLHNKCCQVFNLENNKHTCEVVEGEVDKVLDRARGVYDRLIQITAGGDIDNIDLSPFSPKKQDMIKSILAQLPQDNVTIQYFNLQAPCSIKAYLRFPHRRSGRSAAGHHSIGSNHLREKAGQAGAAFPSLRGQSSRRGLRHAAGRGALSVLDAHHVSHPRR